MSAMITFDDVLWWAGRHGSVGTIAWYLREQAADHSSLSWLRDAWLWRGDVFIAECLSFAKTSLDGLQVIRRALQRLWESPDATLDHFHWRDAARDSFRIDLSQVLQVLDARIERVTRHGSIEPPFGAIRFHHLDYWEADDTEVERVIEALRTRKSEHPAIRFTFRNPTLYLARRVKSLRALPPDALRVFDAAVRELEEASRGGNARERLAQLRDVIAQRIRYLESTGDTRHLWSSEAENRREIWAPTLSGGRQITPGWKNMYMQWKDQRHRFPELDLKGYANRAVELTAADGSAGPLTVTLREVDLDGQRVWQRIVVNRVTREVAFINVDGPCAGQIVHFGKLDEGEDLAAWVERNR
jgi:hypothetical protein